MDFKKLVKSSCMVLALFFTHCTLSKNTAFHMNITLPVSVDACPSLTFFYKGGCYKSDKSTLVLHENMSTTEFYLVVTKDLQRPANVEIESLKTSSQHPYRLFRITRHYRENTSYDDSFATIVPATVEWQVEELPHIDKEIVLPDTTIILLWEPTEIELHTTVSDSLKPFHMLPTLVFKRDQTVEEFNKNFEYMATVCMDFKPFHKIVTKVTKIDVLNRTVVCIPAPLNCYIVS